MKWAWLGSMMFIAACGDAREDVGEEETSCSCLRPRDAGLDGSAAAQIDARAAQPVDSATPFPADCAVILSIDSEGQTARSVSRALDAGTTPLSLWAENRTNVEQSVVINGCNGLELEGLGVYQPNGLCLQGACAPNPPPRVVTLAPGERASLSRRELEVRATACNLNPLAAGDYDLSFSLNAPQTSNVCGPRPLKLSVR